MRFTANTFGQSMNGGGGGWFAITRTASDGIAMYFWPRYDGSVPAEVRNGATSVTPNASWGQPQALFPATNSCDFNSHLAPHQIIINLSFCVSSFLTKIACLFMKFIRDLGLDNRQISAAVVPLAMIVSLLKQSEPLYLINDPFRC